MSINASSRWAVSVGGLVLCLSAAYVPQALALEFTVPFNNEEIEGTLNTTLTVGAAMRMQGQSSRIIGKGNINPDVCAGQQICQATFKNQGSSTKPTGLHPAATATAAPGAFSMNNDDGDLNYDKHDLVSAVGKITQDLSLKYKNFGFFAKALYFYDEVNNNFTEFHPNMITPDNVASLQVNDPSGLPRKVIPKGAPVKSRRNNSSTLDQVGTNLQLLDTYFYGKAPIFDHEISFKLGRQAVNWGESTLNVINSINSANPVNANNFFRVGMQVEEVFTPVGMAFLSTDLYEGITFEGFYQYEWKPLEAPAAGSFYSGSDIVGTNNGSSGANLSFGTAADDPYGLGFLQDNPLSGITPSTAHLSKIKDDKPKGTGQYGIALKYYAEWLNNGTGLGLYYENYHSRLPFASAFATRASCARGADSINHWDPSLAGNSLPSLNGGTGLNAFDTATFGAACSNIPLLSSILNPSSVKWKPGDPASATGALPGTPAMNAAGQPLYSDAVPLDTARLWIEYPRDVHLIGASFNTTFGDLSLQGEVAFRPNAPVQVNPVDVLFAAFGPTLTTCHRGNCVGTALTSPDLVAQITNSTQLSATLKQVLGTVAQTVGSVIDYGPSDVNTSCTPGAGIGTNYGAGCDTFTLLVGHADGSARSFPNYIIPYRGGLIGENSPTDFTKPLNRKNPGYIQGYERIKTAQFDLGATQVFGASDMLPSIIAADQILLLYEVGANWADLPSKDKLQITSDGGTYTSATAGADGSGADGSQQACAGNTHYCVSKTNSPGNDGVDGLRFNPHQAPLGDFANQFAWGYNMVALIRYESVLPGISIESQITVKHDVNGNAPGPGENFLGGRKVFDVLVTTRYKSAFSIGLGYNWITGGGAKNLLMDRDAARAIMKYQF